MQGTRLRAAHAEYRSADWKSDWCRDVSGSRSRRRSAAIIANERGRGTVAGTILINDSFPQGPVVFVWKVEKT